MEDNFSVDVLIVGAGAAGLTLAIDLARRGVSFRLIEKLETPFAGSRGKAIQPRTLEVMEDLGIVNSVAACGGPYPMQREYADDGSTQDSPVMVHGAATPAEPYPAPVMVAQFLSEGVMRARLAEMGKAPEFGCELTSFTQATDGITAQLNSKIGLETVRARYLVGADGGRSFIRQQLGVAFPGKTLDGRGLVADMMLSGLQPDAWHRFGKGPAQVSLCPLVGTPMFQLQCTIPMEGEVDLSAQGLSALVKTRTGRDDITIHEVFWASAYNMNARLADNYRIGRAFLVGDAAHIHPPTGGQGLNTSIQDAYNLGWKLAAVIHGAPEALLDSYEEERRPIAAEMLGLATKLLIALKAGEIKRGREVQQLDLGYPDSSLALATAEQQRGVDAGDRAPDAPMCGAGGQAVRLFDLFKGPHWTLIGFETERSSVSPRYGLQVHSIRAARAFSSQMESSGDSEKAANKESRVPSCFKQDGSDPRGEQGDIIDHAKHFRHAYGLVVGDWLLVRPDGYIGAIVAAGDIAALEAYLDRVGLSKIN